MPQVMAFRASGRLKVSVTMGPSRVTRTSSEVWVVTVLPESAVCGDGSIALHKKIRRHQSRGLTDAQILAWRRAARGIDRSRCAGEVPAEDGRGRRALCAGRR